jgi:hypothetical protein
LFLCVGITMFPLLVFFLFVSIGCSPLLSTCWLTSFAFYKSLICKTFNCNISVFFMSI